MDRVAIGLLGLGTVGSGVVQLLSEGRERIARRSGRTIEVKTALVRDPAKPRNTSLPREQITTDPCRILDDPEIEIVVDVMGGIEPARSLCLAALESGKHLVSANKALLAEHGPEIFAAARTRDRAVAFEGSSGGGVPIVQALGVALAANDVIHLAAILNGTCNYILTGMAEHGVAYESALADAQRLGFAEADPTLDVDGTDTAHKLAILAQVAFDAAVHFHDIPKVGIDTLSLPDLRYARELGYAVKLLALASQTPAGLALRVGPTLVKLGSPLSLVRGPYNAIQVVGDAVGDLLFYGRGAGSMPTASAVVGDVIDVVIGRAALSANMLLRRTRPASHLRLATPAEVAGRNYLRFLIADRPGVLARLAHILGQHQISIASVIQHEPEDPEAEAVPLVIMTHAAVEARLVHALAEIDRLDSVRAPSIRLGVMD